MIETFVNPFELKKLQYFHCFLFPTGHVFDGHTHDSIEINIVFKGIMEVTCGNSVLTAKSGDLVLIKPGLFHKNRVLSVEPCELMAMHFFSDDIKFEKGQYQYQMDNSCIQIAKEFVKEMREKCNMDYWGTSGEITFVAKKLFEVLMLKIKENKNQPDFSEDRESMIYHKSVNFMNRNLNKNVTVSEVASAAGVCETILKRVFSKYTGQSVIAYFTHLRVNKARELLRNGLSCAKVSEQMGFSSQAYFSRCFKKNCGVLPSQIDG